MEYFEKAHVAKKEFTKKDSKSEGDVKKQLKQMLQGYKQSDIKLIRDSENVFNDPYKYFNEDSSSVSGFSDLNLTNSSNEGDIYLGNTGSDAKESNASFLNKSYEGKKRIDLNDSNSVSISSAESISECKDDIGSLSEDPNPNESISSDLSDNISLVSSLMETVTEFESEDSESFDANGVLASKILQKLAESEELIKKKTKKRSIKDEDTIKKDVKAKKLTQIKRNVLSASDEDKIPTIENMHKDFQSEDNTSSFVSVIATEVEVDQSFNEILGDYKHSTVSNMRSDNHIVTHSTNNSSIFSIENMSMDDVQIEEDINDLTYDDNNELSIDENNLKDIESDTVPEEETTNYDDTLQSEQTFERELSTESTEEFVNPVKIYNGNNACVLVLKHPAEIFIHGKICVQLLGGEVDIFGYTLENQICEVYAPNYNCAQRINTVENQNEYYGLFGKLTAAGLAVYEAEDIVTSIGEYDGVIKLSPLRSPKMDFVEDNFKAADLFTKSNKNIDSILKNICDILGCSLYLSKPWKHYTEASVWKPVIEYALDSPGRGIICGGKGLGKSTFLRYNVNRLLTQGPVLVIDLDPGQAEFTVAGNVSATVVTQPLLGPNFTHLSTPEKMLHIGMISPMDNTRCYANAVVELITYCRNNERFASMPWIVNTMGMCNAMGLKFILLIILHTQPTYLLQIDSKNTKKRFDCHLTPIAVRQLYSEYQHDRLFRNTPYPESLEYNFFVTRSSQDSTKSNYSLATRDERYLNYLAYFGALLNSREESLLGITPYEVSYRDLYIGFNIKVDRNAVLKVINGKIVALCQLTQDNDAKVFTLADKPLLCYGHGLIRSIDYAKEILYIITPTLSDLSLTNTLVYADWVPELRGLEKHLPEGIRVPYRTAAAYQQRQLMFAPRRRFNPVQLLKMSRRSS